MHTYFTCLNCGDVGFVDAGKRIEPCHLCNAQNWGMWAQDIVAQATRPRSSEDECPGPNGDDAGSIPAVATKCE